MFFQNIANWSKKLMITVTAICYIIYIGLILIAPAVVIMCKYQVFQKTESMRNITGFGLVVCVVVFILSFLFLKKRWAKLPQITITQQRFKYGVECLFDCIPLGLALFALFAVKDDIDLAFDTMKICLWLFLFGVIWNNLIVKFLDAEWDIRNAARFDKEKAKRTGVV